MFSGAGAVITGLMSSCITYLMFVLEAILTKIAVFVDIACSDFETCY